MFGKNKKTRQLNNKDNQGNLTSEKNLGKALNEPKRLSNVPVIVGVVSVTAFALLIAGGLLGGGTENTHQSEDKKDKPQLNTAAASNDLLEKLNGGGTIDAATIAEPQEHVIMVKQPDKEVEPAVSETNIAEKPPMLQPPSAAQTGNSAVYNGDAQLKQMRTRIASIRQQQFERALSARIGVDTEINSSDRSYTERNSVVDPNDPASVEAERARVRAEINRAQNQYAKISGSTSVYDRGSMNSRNVNVMNSLAYTAEEENNAVNDYASYDRGHDWRLHNTLQNPDNAFMVRAGTVLPATLISGINSDLPGQIIAQVSQNVYDTATGKYLLIPQGTRLIGAYSSQVAYGQERVMVAWQRLIYPDNRALDLGAMPGTDVSGYSGLTDQVNNHWMKLISSAFLMSGIVATVTVATDDDNDSDDDDNSSMNDSMREALATQFGNVLARVIERNLNISPTLEIRPGYKFNVMVTRDMDFFKPYKQFEY